MFRKNIDMVGNEKNEVKGVVNSFVVGVSG